jgi:hypothetical protein
MGPIAVFDKSFLQSLNVDESVWFDNFFLSNISPLFYIETLADLDKAVQESRTPEQEVGLIAAKFPDMHGTPNAHHARLCVGNLMGHSVPMTGQIIIAGARPVKVENKSSIVVENSPESKAFSRWHKGRFLEVERLFAQYWRKSLSTLDLLRTAQLFRIIGIDGKTCKSLKHAQYLAHSVVSEQDNPMELMKLAMLFLSVPRKSYKDIFERWMSAGYPALSLYAPYAAYVLTIEIFFQLAVAANLISSSRPSNRIDIAYLFYLPFCMVFISSDKLHRNCAPLFLRNNQEFVWGPDLKKDLSLLNQHYTEIPEEKKEMGLSAFAMRPPTEKDFLICKIWDRHFPNWRNSPEGMEPFKNEKLVAHIESFAKARTLEKEEVDFNIQNPDSVILHRSVRLKKGSWWQVPKDIKEK